MKIEKAYKVDGRYFDNKESADKYLENKTKSIKGFKKFDSFVRDCLKDKKHCILFYTERNGEGYYDYLEIDNYGNISSLLGNVESSYRDYITPIIDNYDHYEIRDRFDEFVDYLKSDNIFIEDSSDFKMLINFFKNYNITDSDTIFAILDNVQINPRVEYL